MRAVDGTKFCPKCQETKTVDAFGRDKGRADGLKPYCKPCRKVEQAADYQKHKEKRVTKHVAWVAANPGAMAGYAAAWRSKHPDKAKAAWTKQNQKRDKDSHAAYMREHYRDNRDAWLERNRNWRVANLQVWSNGRRKYRDANPELIAALKRSYKARKRGAKGFHTGGDIKDILGRQHWHCIYCSASLRDGYHIDHKTPLSRGGSNWPENLQATCEPCNLRKKDKTHDEFLALINQ